MEQFAARRLHGNKKTKKEINMDEIKENDTMTIRDCLDKASETSSDVIEKVKEGVFKASKEWCDCDFYEVVNRLTKCVADLQIQLRGNINPFGDKIEFRIPECIVGLKNKFGTSVDEFVKRTWTNCYFVPVKEDFCSVKYTHRKIGEVSSYIGSVDSISQIEYENPANKFRFIP